MFLWWGSAASAESSAPVYGKLALRGLSPFGLVLRVSCAGGCLRSCEARLHSFLERELLRRELRVRNAQEGGSVSLKLLLTCAAGDSLTLAHGTLQVHVASHFAHSNLPAETLSETPIWDAWFLGALTEEALWAEVSELARKFSNDYKLYAPLRAEGESQ
jgi:hypothetical protein